MAKKTSHKQKAVPPKIKGSISESGQPSAIQVPLIGILGWNSPRFVELHHDWIESLKKSISSQGGKPIFLGISGGSDYFSSNNHSSHSKTEASAHPYDPSLDSKLKYGLPSRDLIADQIEISAQEEHLNGLVMIPWSINSLVGMLMATVRCGVPTLFAPYYRQWSVFSEIINGQADKKNKMEFLTYSQYSMMVLLEVFGLARIGTLEESISSLSSPQNQSDQNDRSKKNPSANEPGPLEMGIGKNEELAGMVEWIGKRAVEMAKQNISPRRFFSQAAFYNAGSVDCALGSSTETILHLSALAREAEVPLPISFYNEISRRVPQLVEMNRQGEFLIEELVKLGSLKSLLSTLQGYLQPSPTVLGKNIVEIARENVAARPRFKMGRPEKKHGGIYALFGNLSQEGALFRTSGLNEKWLNHSAAAKVFDSEPAAVQAILSKKVNKGEAVVVRYCGPKGNPGMPYLSALKKAIEQRGLEDSIIVLSDGRPLLSGRTPAIVQLSPEAAVGSPLSILQNGDLIVWNCFDRTLFVRLTDTEIKVRLSRWKEQERNMKNSFLFRYAKYSSSSSLGATVV